VDINPQEQSERLNMEILNHQNLDIGHRTRFSNGHLKIHLPPWRWKATQTWIFSKQNENIEQPTWAYHKRVVVLQVIEVYFEQSLGVF
jgi:hypothetical protein